MAIADDFKTIGDGSTFQSVTFSCHNAAVKEQSFIFTHRLR